LQLIAGEGVAFSETLGVFEQPKQTSANRPNMEKTPMDPNRYFSYLVLHLRIEVIVKYLKQLTNRAKLP
jgi:hypothetical protein